MILNLIKQPEGIKVFDDLLASNGSVHALISLRGRFVNRGLGCKYIDQRKAVTGAHLVVVEVVGGRDLDAAGAEFAVDVVVGNYWNFSTNQGQHDVLAYKVGIPLILWVYGDCCIAEHGFGPGGRDHQVVFVIQGHRAVGEGITKVP